MKDCSFIGRIETFPFALYHKAALIECAPNFTLSAPFDKLAKMCHLFKLFNWTCVLKRRKIRS